MSKEEKKVNRRDFLFTASYTIGAVGVGVSNARFVESSRNDPRGPSKECVPLLQLSSTNLR